MGEKVVEYVEQGKYCVTITLQIAKIDLVVLDIHVKRFHRADWLALVCVGS